MKKGKDEAEDFVSYLITSSFLPSIYAAIWHTGLLTDRLPRAPLAAMRYQYFVARGQTSST